jgi:catalase
VFFVRTVEDFRRLTEAAIPPASPPPRTVVDGLIDSLSLRTPPPNPNPGDAGAVAFSASHPEACPAIASELDGATPESYASCSYHAAHAFALTHGNGTRTFVRFSWEPVIGVRHYHGTADRFLLNELRSRRGDEAVRFVLQAQVADQGDDTSDPSRPWPHTRRRLVLGRLTLDGFGPDDPTESFNPHHLPDGHIAPDPRDEIFAVRGEVYQASFRRREDERLNGVRTA